MGAAGKHHGVAVLDGKRHGGENSTDRYDALPWPRASLAVGQTNALPQSRGRAAAFMKRMTAIELWVASLIMIIQILPLAMQI